MPAVGTGYPTLETLCNSIRFKLNDTFSSATGQAGGGRIFTDDAPFTLPIINEAMADFQRELDNASIPTETNEVFLFNIPPVNSLLGATEPNPVVQQKLSFTGFFDGLTNYPVPALPVDLLVPKRAWYRQSNTGLTFAEFFPAAAGLQSLFQDQTPGQWDWRGTAIYWNGAVTTIDVRLRYTKQIGFFGDVPPASFAETPLPFKDSVEVLAYFAAEKFCAARLPDGATNGLLAKGRAAMDQVINREVKRMQSVKYSRGAYGETGDIFNF